MHRKVQLIVSGGIRTRRGRREGARARRRRRVDRHRGADRAGRQQPRATTTSTASSAAPPGFYDDWQAGRDPAGISTQDEELAARLDPVVGGRRLANYLRVLTLETQTLARACGKSHVHNLEPEDLVALTVEAAAMARVPLAGTSWIPGVNGVEPSAREIAPAASSRVGTARRAAALPKRETGPWSATTAARLAVAAEDRGRDRVQLALALLVGLGVPAAADPLELGLERAGLGDRARRVGAERAGRAGAPVNASITFPAAVACATDGRPSCVTPWTSCVAGTKSIVTASGSPGTESVAVSPVSSTSVSRCGRATRADVEPQRARGSRGATSRMPGPVAAGAASRSA